MDIQGHGNEPNPRNLETLTMGKELLQISDPAGYKRPELPTHTVSTLEEPCTETGAACFGPQTLLLVQNPMNQDTYDSGKSLTRPIERIDHGSLVLAEKQDTKGKSIFFLSRVMCVMIFEIPQEGDPEGGHKLAPGTTSPLRLRVKVIDHHTNNITPWLRNTQLFPHRLRILGDARTRAIDLHIPAYPGQTCLNAILLSLQIVGCDAHLQPGDTIGFAIISHTSRTEPDQSEPMQGEHNNTPNLQLNRPSLTSIPRSNGRIG